MKRAPLRGALFYNIIFLGYFNQKRLRENFDG